MSSEFKIEDPALATAVLRRVGHLVRQLRDGLKELGLDHQVELATSAIPDSRERLNYIAKLSEQAAKRVLDAIDVASPELKVLKDDASRLQGGFAAWQAAPAPLAPDSPLAQQAAAFFATAADRLAMVKAQHTEITLAQDFQDLTGQVIKKTLDMIQEVETELLQVLVEHAPRTPVEETNLQSGPQIKANQPNAVSSQEEVDNFLASLDF